MPQLFKLKFYYICIYMYIFSAYYFDVLSFYITFARHKDTKLI